MSVANNIKLLKWFNFFTDLKFYGPIAVIYFSRITDSFALAMSIFSVVFLSSAIFEIPTGVLSDYIGRKKTLILGSFFAVIYTVFYALGISYWVLVIGAFFEGLSRALYSGNNEALLYDSLSDDLKSDFGSHFGKTASMFQIALAICALLGGVIANISFSIVLWISVIPQIICLVIGLALISPRIPDKVDTNIYSHIREAVSLIHANKKLKNLSMAMILNKGIAEAAFDFQAAFYNTVWPLWAIGIAKMLSYTGAAFSFFYSGKLINRFGELKIIIFRHLSNRILFSIALLFPNILSPLLMSTGSLLYGAEITATQSLAHKEFHDNNRATLGSLVSFCSSIVFTMVAVILGILADKFGPAKALFIGQLALVFVLYIYYSLFKNKNTA